ncbi:hypothetical protein MMC10_008888 [Thelotrema lepadinum]|nr:hypothetical protein [Thelotrema lepadinum]
MVDEIIRDIAPLNDGTSDDGVETIKLAPGEVFTEIDLFEGDAGLGLRVIYIDSFESLLTLFRCVQMQDVRNLSVSVPQAFTVSALFMKAMRRIHTLEE